MCTNLKDIREHEDWMICQIGLCRGWAVLMVPRGCKKERSVMTRMGYRASKVDSTTNKCESWMTTSGSFCTADGSPGNLQLCHHMEVRRLRQWQRIDLCERSPIANYIPQQVVKLENPHVSRIDGEKYLLLQHGSFNFWQFSGLECWGSLGWKCPEDRPRISLWWSSGDFQPRVSVFSHTTPASEIMEALTYFNNL